ncbi:MAG: chitobiase/beta-hexosaminidase C-terminal domain-containing protein [Prevotella sp.]|nr:chitobiase/beta-hexosaminidase C-terminal domain-containing protein [Prevotella sp.]
MKKILSIFALLMTIVIGAKASTVDDLATISADYTFIADNITNNGTTGLTKENLYDNNRIFSPLGNNVSTQKGSSTIGGVSHYNSLRIKSSTQDVLAFKVSGACTMTIYAQTTGKTGKDARPIKVGNAINDDTYGIVTDVNEEHVVEITSAGVVYLTGTSDRYIAGFDLVFPAGEDAPGNPVFDPEAGEVPAETAVTISSTGAATILYQWGATAIGQTGDWTAAETYSTTNKPVVPALGSANNVLSVKASNTYGDTYGSATYTITNPVVANPVLPATGSFNDSKSIEITCATDGASIQYSFDNSTWNNYTEAFSITSTTTVYAKATKTDYVDSEVVSATYTKLDPGTDGNVEDLTAVTAGYTFIADDVTGGVSKIKPDNKLYGDGKIYINGVATSKTDKGSSTIGGNSYYNSINLSSGYVAFKTDGPVKVTIYGGNNSGRNFMVGTADDDDKYGEAPKGQIAWGVIIPEAATVYIKQKTSGDYCLAGLVVSDIPTETITPAKEYTTFSCTKALNFSEVEGLEAYAAVSAASGKVVMTKVTDIPANTGLVLKKTGSAESYDVPEGTATSLGVDNKLVAATTATEVEAYNGTTVFNYILKNGEFHPATAGTLAAGKAYLSLEASAGQQGLVMDFDDAPTAVEAVAEAKVNVNVPVKVIKNGQLFIGNYNVAGARVK